MSRWPWPEVEVEFFTTRALRAMEGHPRRRELVHVFLVHLAAHGEPGSNRPVRELKTWVKKEPQARLRYRIEHEDVRRLAEREVGWQQRRGDLVRIRAKSSWWDIRK